MLIQRLNRELQNNDKSIDAIISFAKNNAGALDEVWFASLYGFPPLLSHEKEADKIALLKNKFLSAGIKTSLQISNTLGHGSVSHLDNGGLIYEGSTAGHAVDLDGRVYDYVFCFRDKTVRDYNAKTVKIYAEKIKPDTVWFDDDLRFCTSYSVLCFCDNCIKSFNSLYGYSFTRKELAEKMRSDIKIRKEYAEFSASGMAEFAEILANAVHSVSPLTAIGYQQIAAGSFPCYGFDYIYNSFYKATGINPKSRPGGGCYSDENPRNMLFKASYLCAQKSMLPDCVDTVCPEIENLPFTPFNKSVAGTMKETSLYFAYAGATEMSYSMMMHITEPILWYENFFKEFGKHRAFWEKLVESNKKSTQTGFYYFMSKSLISQKDTGEEGVFYNYEPWEKSSFWYPVGLPISYENQDAFVTLLVNDVASRMQTDEKRGLLSRPVITDGKTLKEFATEFPDYFDCKVEDLDCSPYSELFDEKFTDISDVDRFSVTAYHRPKAGYSVSGNAVTPVGYLYSGVDDKIHGVVNAVITLKNGVKWAVFGCSPWHSFINTAKKEQIINVAEFISGKKIPAFVSSPLQATVMPRTDKNGKTLSVSVLNLTVADSGEISVVINDPAGETPFVIYEDGKTEKAGFVSTESGVKVVLKNLPSYGFCHIYF